MCLVAGILSYECDVAPRHHPDDEVQHFSGIDFVSRRCNIFVSWFCLLPVQLPISVCSVLCMSSGRSDWLGAYAVHTGEHVSYSAFVWLRRGDPYAFRVGTKPRYPVPSADCCSKWVIQPLGCISCLMIFLYEGHDYVASLT